MGILSKNVAFLVALVAVIGVSVGSVALTQTITFGAETDVGLETDLGFDDSDQGGTIVLPPAAPVQQPAATSNDAGVGDATSLPSAGNGGYLPSSSNSLSYALASLAIVLLMTGSIAVVYARK